MSTLTGINTRPLAHYSRDRCYDIIRHAERTPPPTGEVLYTQFNVSLNFLHSTLVLSLYIDVVLTLSTTEVYHSQFIIFIIVMLGNVIYFFTHIMDKICYLYSLMSWINVLFDATEFLLNSTGMEFSRIWKLDRCSKVNLKHLLILAVGQCSFPFGNGKNGRYFAGSNLKCIFLEENFYIVIWIPMTSWSLFRVPLKINIHWFK